MARWNHSEFDLFITQSLIFQLDMQLIKSASSHCLFLAQDTHHNRNIFLLVNTNINKLSYLKKTHKQYFQTYAEYLKKYPFLSVFRQKLSFGNEIRETKKRFKIIIKHVDSKTVRTRVYGICGAQTNKKMENDFGD